MRAATGASLAPCAISPRRSSVKRVGLLLPATGSHGASSPDARKASPRTGAAASVQRRNGLSQGRAVRLTQRSALGRFECRIVLSLGSRPSGSLRRRELRAQRLPSLSVTARTVCRPCRQPPCGSVRLKQGGSVTLLYANARKTRVGDRPNASWRFGDSWVIAAGCLSGVSLSLCLPRKASLCQLFGQSNDRRREPCLAKVAALSSTDSAPANESASVRSWRRWLRSRRLPPVVRVVAPDGAVVRGRCYVAHRALPRMRGLLGRAGLAADEGRRSFRRHRQCTHFSCGSRSTLSSSIGSVTLSASARMSARGVSRVHEAPSPRLNCHREPRPATPWRREWCCSWRPPTRRAQNEHRSDQALGVHGAYSARDGRAHLQRPMSNQGGSSERLDGATPDLPGRMCIWTW